MMVTFDLSNRIIQIQFCVGIGGPVGSGKVRNYHITSMMILKLADYS